jgi:hypothetical protein
MKIALKIRPQRSTQYSAMLERLAAPEVLASPVGSAIQEVAPATLAGQRYLLATLRTEMAEGAMMPILSRLGAISEVYQYFEQLGDLQGPLLRPLEPQFTPFVPVEMAEARRYKGKTNEIFSRVLLNLALFAGAYAGEFTGRLRILDPLAGGGTSLFLALAAGYDTFGIDIGRRDIETTALFIRQYLQSERILFKELDERGRRAGRRHQFEIGAKKATRVLVLAHGDTAQANLHMQEVPGGPHMHAIIGDLPYGIQHFAEIAGLLQKALPVWEQLLLPGGTLGLAWNATRIKRAQLLELVESYSSLKVCTEPAYTQLAHAVDRVIKQRDVLVALKCQASSTSP